MQEKLANRRITKKERQRLNSEFHIYKTADFFNVSPTEVYNWDDVTIELATSYIAEKEGAEIKARQRKR